MSEIRFNVNHHVWVKITPAGRNALRDHWARYGMGPPTYNKEQDGWTRYQLHDLMNQFGEVMRMGPPVPFETEIRLEIESGGSEVEKGKAPSPEDVTIPQMGPLNKGRVSEQTMARLRTMILHKRAALGLAGELALWVMEVEKLKDELSALEQAAAALQPDTEGRGE